MLGTGIASVIYIFSTISIMGLVKPSVLQASPAPFTDAASVLWGQPGSIIIGITAIIACIGAINGWILIQGQIAFAIAKDNLFPRIFAKQSKHGAPYIAIIASSIISSLVIIINFTDSLISMFSFTSELSTVQTLIAFLFCAIASVLLINRSEKINKKSKLTGIIIALFAFLYGLFVVANADPNIVYWCMLMLLIGLPIYAVVKK